MNVSERAEIIRAAENFFGIQLSPGTPEPQTATPQNSHQPIATGWTEKVIDGKRVRLLDLGQKGVLPAAWAINSRTPRRKKG